MDARLLLEAKWLDVLEPLGPNWVIWGVAGGVGNPLSKKTENSDQLRQTRNTLFKWSDTFNAATFNKGPRHSNLHGSTR